MCYKKSSLCEKYLFYAIHPTVLISLNAGLSSQQAGVREENRYKHLQICKTKQNKKQGKVYHIKRFLAAVQS